MIINILHTSNGRELLSIANTARNYCQDKQFTIANMKKLWLGVITLFSYSLVQVEWGFIFLSQPVFLLIVGHCPYFLNCSWDRDFQHCYRWGAEWVAIEE